MLCEALDKAGKTFDPHTYTGAWYDSYFSLNHHSEIWIYAAWWQQVSTELKWTELNHHQQETVHHINHCALSLHILLIKFHFFVKKAKSNETESLAIFTFIHKQLKVVIVSKWAFLCDWTSKSRYAVLRGKGLQKLKSNHVWLDIYPVSYLPIVSKYKCIWKPFSEEFYIYSQCHGSPLQTSPEI